MQRSAAAASVGRPGLDAALMGAVPETTPTSALRPSVRSYQAAQRALSQRAMTPEAYSAAAPSLGESASGRAIPTPTDEQMASGIAATTPWASARGFEHLQRLMGTVKSTASPPMREELDRSLGREELDRSLARESEIEPRGNLNVNVKAPNGTSVKADGDGMFKGNVSLERQMELPTLQ